MTTLTFPGKSWGKYFDGYVRNIEIIFKSIDYPIEYDPTLKHMQTPYGPANNIFEIKINGKPALIDLSDKANEFCYKFVNNQDIKLGKMYEYSDYDMPIFKKMHPNIKYADNVYPYGPLCMTSLDCYKKLINYKPNFTDNRILGISHTNRIYASAVLSRKVAFQKIGRCHLDPKVRFEKNRLSQPDHYERLKNCIGCLEIGAFNGAQGTGAIEAFLCGTPVISDNMDMILPYNKKIEKHEHYIFVEDDYNNINEAISYVYTNRKEVIEKAKRVHDLFLKTWHPTKLVKWFDLVTEQYYD